MLDEIDALVALQMFGTVSEAATRLRLTQSAVSKRLQSLQSRLRLTLVEPDGRRLRLTAAAVDFLERAVRILRVAGGDDFAVWQFDDRINRGAVAVIGREGRIECAVRVQARATIRVIAADLGEPAAEVNLAVGRQLDHAAPTVQAPAHFETGVKRAIGIQPDVGIGPPGARVGSTGAHASDRIALISNNISARPDPNAKV